MKLHQVFARDSQTAGWDNWKNCWLDLGELVALPLFVDDGHDGHDGDDDDDDDDDGDGDGDGGDDDDDDVVVVGSDVFDVLIADILLVDLFLIST